MTEKAELLDRITVRADIFDGKPIIRGMRIAVEHVLGKLAAGDTAETILGQGRRLIVDGWCPHQIGPSSDRRAHFKGWAVHIVGERPSAAKAGSADGQKSHALDVSKISKASIYERVE